MMKDAMQHFTQKSYETFVENTVDKNSLAMVQWHCRTEGTTKRKRVSGYTNSRKCWKHGT